MLCTASSLHTSEIKAQGHLRFLKCFLQEYGIRLSLKGSSTCIDCLRGNSQHHQPSGITRMHTVTPTHIMVCVCCWLTACCCLNEAKGCKVTSASAKVFLACSWKVIMRSPNWRWAKALLASTPAAFRISVFTLLSPPFRSFSSTLIAEICKRQRPLHPQSSSLSIVVVYLLQVPFHIV